MAKAHVPIESQVEAMARCVDWLASRHPDPAQMAHLRAALATLTWFRENHKALRCVAGTLAGIKRDPAVRAVLDTWPGAEIVAYRETYPETCPETGRETGREG